MGFIDSYKHLEKLCGDVLNDEWRISAYIDAMLNTPSGAYYVAGWNDDLKQLKHYRWVRNQIVHEPGCSEDNLCTPEDTRWLDAFYSRILHQTDPLALYRKATQPRRMPKAEKRNKQPHWETVQYAFDEQPKAMRWTIRKTIALLIAVILLALAIWTVWGNTALECNTYTIVSNRIPAAFDGYRIAHVSDLHNDTIGEGNERLLSMLREAKPDMIAVTGDLIDSRDTDTEIAFQFMKEAMEIAPCYYVAGNHEARVEEFSAFKQWLINLGVVVLENQRMELKREGTKISLIGVNDPSFQTDYLLGDSAAVMQDNLQGLTDEETFAILLSHRPELFDIYVENKIDLVLSGHAHGGQARLPFIGGLFAPNQGIFPKFDAGAFTEGSTAMIVSRGVGNSAFPLRFNNRPEVIVIELKCKPTDK